jgi:hypothetical protein
MNLLSCRFLVHFCRKPTKVCRNCCHMFDRIEEVDLWSGHSVREGRSGGEARDGGGQVGWSGRGQLLSE